MPDANVPLPVESGGQSVIRRYGYVLVLALIVVSYALCAAQGGSNPSAAVLLVQLATVAVILQVAEVRLLVRRVGWIVIAAGAVAVVVGWSLGASGMATGVVLSGASALAYLVATIAIIAQQARSSRTDAQTLLSAIAAYILVGMFFTFVYNFVALVTVVPAFGAGHPESLSSQLFFSFTTITTTGYGNLVPVTATVQSVAVAEAITGQLFLVIAVARVVSSWRSSARR